MPSGCSSIDRKMARANILVFAGLVLLACACVQACNVMSVIGDPRIGALSFLSSSSLARVFLRLFPCFYHFSGPYIVLSLVAAHDFFPSLALIVLYLSLTSLLGYGGSMAVARGGTVLYVNSGGQFTVVNVTDPFNPYIISSVASGACSLAFLANFVAFAV